MGTMTSPTFALAVILTGLLALSHAQCNDIPPLAAVMGPQYTTVNGTFYVQGGLINTHSTSSDAFTTGFYSLDLTKPFNVQSPPWKALAITSGDNNSSPKVWDKSMTASLDRKSIYIWGGGGSVLVKYDIPIGVWTKTTDLGGTSFSSLGGIRALMDPSSSSSGEEALLIPNGCLDPNTPTMPTLCSVSAEYGKQDNVTQSPMPIQMTESVNDYSWVLSEMRNSMMLYGGTGVVTGAPNPNLFELVYSTKSWKLLQTQGPSPGEVSSHCMVQTSDNNRMILFGGLVGDTVKAKVFSSSIYILDIKTLTWTKGPDAPINRARSSHACATNGDSFIVWGGRNQDGVMPNTLMIYNIPVGQWVQEYVVSGPVPNTTTNDNSNSSCTTTGGNNTASSASKSFSLRPWSIPGRVAGGFFIVALAIDLFL
ncbi:hypothetical protein BGZ83_011687 [Gryganskiella cystojenkinii]|nr:hypothetical protein BGZ83_011687 [Gryganskiella cystojenkinii]